MAYRYLSVLHSIHPHPESKTEMKDWGSKGKKHIQENLDFAGKVTDHNLTAATYILDIVEMKMIKNRYRDHENQEKAVPDDKVIEYLLKTHKADILKMGWKEEELKIE